MKWRDQQYICSYEIKETRQSGEHTGSLSVVIQWLIDDLSLSDLPKHIRTTITKK